jgi:hypothetical protein
MPKTQEIIASLQSLANDYSFVAIIWHILFYILLAFLIAKWNPSNKLLGVLICLPLLSVAVFAWIAGNPFNGTIFSLLAILILIFSLRASSESITVSTFPYYLIGILMIAFGLVYPHFLNTDSLFKYFYASPLGLVPCPTLSLLIGFLLLYNGFGSNSISIAFIVIGLFYGIFGVFKLGVNLDLSLLLGTITLLIKYFVMLKNPIT